MSAFSCRPSLAAQKLYIKLRDEHEDAMLATSPVHICMEGDHDHVTGLNYDCGFHSAKDTSIFQYGLTPAVLQLPSQHPSLVSLQENRKPPTATMRFPVSPGLPGLAVWWMPWGPPSMARGPSTPRSDAAWSSRRYCVAVASAALGVWCVDLGPFWRFPWCLLLFGVPL